MIAGIGIDIVDIERVRRVMEGEAGERFTERTFTEKEKKYCRKFRNPYPHFAGRFAAKEAFIKAASGMADSIPLKSIEVTNSRSGAPSIAANSLDFKKYRINISISHTDSAACACVVVEEKE
jgi:holo-[acyl-carrier protein] synthase